MPNHFFAVTSNGGYFGRFCWSNTGTMGRDPKDHTFWGTAYLWPVEANDASAWAGSTGLTRYFTLRTLR